MIGECLATAWDDWTESLSVAVFLSFSRLCRRREKDFRRIYAVGSVLFFSIVTEYVDTSWRLLKWPGFECKARA